MGEVFLARDRRLKRLVAVKKLRKELASDPVACKRFEREAQAAARISHANVASIFAIGRDTGATPCIVMEYIDGRNLADIIESRGSFDVSAGKEILSQLAAALAAAHRQGVIHRDVRPANVMIEKGTGRVVLTDFGIAGIEETGSEAVTKLTKIGERVGDLRYMSPEQLRGDAVTEQADIYSFGIVAYELFASQSPYLLEGMADPASAHLRQEPRNLTSLCTAFPVRFAALLKRCLAKRAEHRPTAAELAMTLSTAAGADDTKGDSSSFSLLGGFFAELKQREVYKAAAAYLAVSFVILESVDLILPAVPLPELTFTALVTALLAGFPIAIVLAWIYDYRHGRITATGDTESAYQQGTTRRQRVVVAIAGLSFCAGLAALVGWWLLSS